MSLIRWNFNWNLMRIFSRFPCISQIFHALLNEICGFCSWRQNTEWRVVKNRVTSRELSSRWRALWENYCQKKDQINSACQCQRFFCRTRYLIMIQKHNQNRKGMFYFSLNVHIKLEMWNTPIQKPEKETVFRENNLFISFACATGARITLGIRTFIDLWK